MKIAIDKIKVAVRIRKEINNVSELAENIRAHGLISPIAVMPQSGGEFQLLAGLRRLRAMELNGETEIDSKVFPATDAETAFRIEYWENEQREPFTLAEKMEYAAVILEIERAKALERKSIGGQGGLTEDVAQARHLVRGRTDAIVGDKVGMKETSYRYARIIAENSPETIERIDNGEISLRAAYREVRAKDKPTSSKDKPAHSSETEVQLKDNAKFQTVESKTKKTQSVESQTVVPQTEEPQTDESQLTPVSEAGPNHQDKLQPKTQPDSFMPKDDSD